MNGPLNSFADLTESRLVNGSFISGTRQPTLMIRKRQSKDSSLVKEETQSNQQEKKSRFSRPLIRIDDFRRKILITAYALLFALRTRRRNKPFIESFAIARVQNEQTRLLNTYTVQLEKKNHQFNSGEKDTASSLSPFRQSTIIVTQSIFESKGYSSSSSSSNGWMDSLSYWLINLLNSIPVIHPNSNKLLFWDLMNFTFIILNVIYVPIETVIVQSFSEMYGPKW